MKNITLKTRHSLRFSVISRLFALIIVLLIVLGGYQYYQTSQQANDSAESDREIANSYFSTVLVQAIWVLDEALINELVAAQSNISSLMALSVSSLYQDIPPLFVRNEKNSLVRSSTAAIPVNGILSNELDIYYEDQKIATIVLYFDNDYYQKIKRHGITRLLLQISVLAFFLLVLFYFFINRYVVMPISNLYESVERLSHDKSLKLDLQHDLPDNEIKLLAQKYSDVYHQLSAHKDNLEELVAVRTTGLENANAKMKVEIESRIASEEAMELAKIAAQDANQAKTKFLSHITHELRTPLNGILGYAQILSDRNLPETEKEYTSHILRCSDHLLGLINNILDHSKMESSSIDVKPLATSIEKLFEEIKTIVYPRCSEKRLSFTINIASDIPTEVLVDANKLKQVLINLLANAIKFTDKGFVGVSVEKVSNDNYLFSVKDSGQGIQLKDQEGVFEAYHQSEDNETVDASTGLGLSISKTFIESMKSDLHLESEVGKGSCFFFTLHLLEVKDVDHQVTRGEIVNIHHSEKMTVLVVDDTRDNLFILRKVLEKVGFNVVDASSGESAIKEVERQLPDLIFMDVQMPGMNGNEAARAIKENHSKLKIVAFTANLYDELCDKEKFTCFDDYIYKPIDRQAIYRILIKLLNLNADYK